MLENLKKETLLIDVNYDLENKNLKLTWKGKSINRTPEIILTPFFDEVIDEAKTSNLSLSIDFFKLDYMNSSTINPIISFVKRLIAEDIKTNIIYNKDLKWQELSFSSLNIFTVSSDSVTLQAEHKDWKL